MPGRLCKVCGSEKRAKIVVCDGVALYTFPKRCGACAKTNKTSKTPGVKPRPRVEKPKKKVVHKRQRRHERLKNAPGGPYDPIRYVDRVEYYGFQCAYCTVEPATTLDHCIPVSRGGSNWPANIRPACASCNTEKGSLLLMKEWVPPNRRN